MDTSALTDWLVPQLMTKCKAEAALEPAFRLYVQAECGT